MNRILGCYTPIPMGAFYTVAKLPMDDAEKFCAWCLSDFRWKDEKTPKTTHFSGQDLECTGETIMMAPAAGFYASTSSATDSTTVSEQGRTIATGSKLGHNQVRLAYVLCKEDIQRSLFLLEKAIEKYNSL